MKTLRLSIVSILLIVSFAAEQRAYSQDPLPKYITIELKRLEETWHILDVIGAKIWPGWTGYADVPFLFTYTNGVQLLVGHPNPPEGFSLVAGVEVKGKKVFWDRRKEVQLPMPPPLLGGGGPIPYGSGDGKQVWVVRIDARPLRPSAEKEASKSATEDAGLASENQILLNIHELFHCFQRSIAMTQHGNLRFNTDENFSTFAEIEGLALERAYLERSDSQAKEYVKDFLVARQLKRSSMDETERMQESEEDVSEGTATFTELMTASLVDTQFPHTMSQQDDPFFFHFRYADSLRQRKLDMLRNNRSASLSSRDKCYSFGCFQAVLLTRFSPGWREGFFQGSKKLDNALELLLPMTAEERQQITGRIKSRYGYDTIYTRHAEVLGERNRAYEMIQKRKGLSFVVNFKNTGEFVSAEPYGKTSRLGLLYIYPAGIKQIKMADVLFEGKETPMVNDQLYYVKWIDCEAKEGQKRYELRGEREGNSNVYKNVIIETAGFTLRAPKVEIRENHNRVKLTVLEKIKH